MKTSIINCTSKPQVLMIGRQLENNYRQFVFDCSAFGSDIESITLVHQRKTDVAPYLVTTSNTDTLTWTVSDTDTAFSGYGRAELRVEFADGLAKSAIYSTCVLESITADATIPEPLQSWYDAMIEYIDDHSVSPEEIEQAVADYLEEHPITAPVTSVNSKIGDVVLSASDVGALPDSTVIPTKTSQLQNDSGYITSAPVTSVNGQTGAVTIAVPTKTSDLQNDSGYITSVPVTSVNSKTGAVSLSASDVGALPSTTTYVSSFNGSTGAVTYSAPVTSVNGQTGAVSLSIPTVVTYTISISSNVITLTGSDSSTSTVTLPVYNGGIS